MPLSNFFEKLRLLSRNASSSSSQTPPAADGDIPYGLEVVYEGPGASLDIVAVHGLNGHREKTWTAANGVHWLRDLLSKDLPNVRVLTWGYDANTHSRDRVNHQYIHDHGMELVGQLVLERTLTNSTRRPIIFVAHSLGGIVLKDALIYSDGARHGARHEDRSVKTSTYGIIFMGTPHQGGNGVGLARLLTNIASIFVPADDRILKHLKRDSEMLQQELHRYSQISGDFVTKFAYETYETPIFPGRTMMVVPKVSAVVPGQGDAETIAIHSNHTEMVKYPSRGDQGYKRISGTLQIMAGKAGEVIYSRWEGEDRVENVRTNATVRSFKLPPVLPDVPDVPRFVAREDEMRQMDQILAEPGERRTVILHGLGGMGKTQLAREYIKRYRTRFSAMIWMNARDITSLQQSYMRAAQRICRYHPSIIYLSDAVQSQKLEECVEAVNQWLDEPANGGWIIVYDNYDNPKFGNMRTSNRERDKTPDHAIPATKDSQAVSRDEDSTQEAFDIQPFLPRTDHGAVIVTTRSAEVELGKCIKVEKLTDQKSSLEILASTSDRVGIDQDEGVGRLVERLDGLPLALATAGAYLKGAPATSFAKYLALYESSWQRLLKSSPRVTAYDERTLFTTWNISYNRIKHENEASAKLLRLWAYFDHQDLWYELLREGLSGGQREHLNGLVDEKDEISFNEAIMVLQKYGLTEAEESTREWALESQGYSMHACVHLWIQHGLNDSQAEENLQMARLAMECIGKHIPRDDTKEYWLIQRRLLKHANQCLASTQESIKLDEETEYLYSYFGHLYHVQGQLAKATAILERILQSQEAWGPGHTPTLITINNLGNLYGDQGQLKKAEEMYQRALQGKEKALRPGHISTLITINNLGNLYRNQGQLKKAEEMYQRALQGKEKALGPRHTSTLNTINNLGLLYRNQGQLKKAEEMYQRALQGYEKALGPEHISTLNTINNLGNLYRNQGQLKKAEEMYQRALQGKEKALGPRHTSTLNTINNLGLLYGNQGQLKKAEEMYQRALQGKEKALGPRHTSTLNTINNLGLLYRSQGQLKKAEEMYQRALQGYENALGIERAKTYPPALNTLRNLGVLFHKLNDKETSRKYLLREKDGCGIVYGLSSKRYLEIVSGLEALDRELSE